MGDLIDLDSRRPKPKPAVIDPMEPTKTVNMDEKLEKVKASIKRINDLCRTLNEKR